MATTAIYAGSFDPITRGHEDLITRSCAFVDKLVVAVARNSAKKPLFTADERVALIRKVTQGNDCVDVRQFEGLLVNFARSVNASLIIRGLRAMSDFEYEFQMALMNRRLVPELETVFMMPAESYTYISSRVIREVFALGGPIAGLVPEVVEARMRALRAAR